MNKKIMFLTMVAVLAAVPVFAAVEQNQPQNDWMNQMMDNHKQMAQQAVDNGTMTADQAVQMNEHMTQMAPIMQQMMQNGGMMHGNGNMMGNSK